MVVFIKRIATEQNISWHIFFSTIVVGVLGIRQKVWSFVTQNGQPGCQTKVESNIKIEMSSYLTVRKQELLYFNRNNENAE